MRHAIFPHRYARFCLFFFLFSVFCFGTRVYGRHAGVTIPVALQYARLVGTKCRLTNVDCGRVLAQSNDGLGIILKFCEFL